MTDYVAAHESAPPNAFTIAVNLAVEGRVEEALKKWMAHQNEKELCICQGRVFDPVCCGVCFTGRLLYMDLKFGAGSKKVDFLKVAHVVSDYIKEKSSHVEHGLEYYQPISA